MSLDPYVVIGWGFGMGTGWTLHKMWARRQLRRLRSNWEPGLTITTSDGETLYVSHVESPSGSDPNG